MNYCQAVSRYSDLQRGRASKDAVCSSVVLWAATHAEARALLRYLLRAAFGGIRRNSVPVGYRTVEGATRSYPPPAAGGVVMVRLALAVAFAMTPTWVSAQTSTFTISAPSADVYKAPSTGSPVIGYAPRGTAL